MEWKNERPGFCPHPDCTFKMRAQDRICIGALQAREEHDDDYNTHRLCIDAGGPVFDLQVNRSDVYHFRRLFNAIFPVEHEMTAQYWKAMYEDQLRRKREAQKHT